MGAPHKLRHPFEPKTIRGFIVERWMIFEDSVRDYLEKEVKISGIRFVGRGKSDSTSSDIDVFYKESFLFSVEAKLVPSQCGQFVVIKDQESYKYSEKNVERENAFSTEIISELNKRKGIFGNVGTGAIFINLYTDAFYGWIIEHYKNKKVRFIFTSTSPSNFENGFIRSIRLEDLKKFFKATACLRRKKSGSRGLSRMEFDYAISILKNKFGSHFTLKKDGLVSLPGLSNKRVYLPENFLLSRIGDYYRIRKLSTTNNPNVIFSLEYIGPTETNSLDEFKKEIEKEISKIMP